MLRIVLACLLVLALAPLKAQGRFIAPNQYPVLPLIARSNSAVHMLFASNNSTVPIVLFGTTLSSCENVRQSCGSQRTRRARSSESVTVLESPSGQLGANLHVGHAGDVEAAKNKEGRPVP